MVLCTCYTYGTGVHVVLCACPICCVVGMWYYICALFIRGIMTCVFIVMYYVYVCVLCSRLDVGVCIVLCCTPGVGVCVVLYAMCECMCT